MSKAQTETIIRIDKHPQLFDHMMGGVGMCVCRGRGEQHFVLP